MEKSNDKSSSAQEKPDKEDKNKVPDSLLYPPSEDIYNQLKKESDVDPEDISKNKAPVEIDNVSELNEKNFEEDVSGGDLDIPGSELDDELENSGSEDEENNHYGIVGDNHSNLDEDDG
ncbi:hypothetical protein [Flavobacterium urumqiense]|uniref:Uncharacterized protein n=1 Tax=Flavobacterium urumqiense TaxID=935224 RepID=A0A1H5ZJZ4_9FLAO|nr:hypothetical protein [Flavobacterium urumqiense]SEG35967.1 hypothetical protein SAMN04488130_11076 [Flavobacterium urumqiense]